MFVQFWTDNIHYSPSVTGSAPKPLSHDSPFSFPPVPVHRYTARAFRVREGPWWSLACARVSPLQAPAADGRGGF